MSVEGYTTDLVTAKAVDFIRRHAGTPFSRDVAFNAPHWPFQRPGVPSVAVGNARFLQPSDSSTSTRADYAAMVERLDRGVGEILAGLERHGLARNTSGTSTWWRSRRRRWLGAGEVQRTVPPRVWTGRRARVPVAPP